MVEVTQADRDAAAAWAENSGWSQNIIDAFRSGECDHHPLAQAFAHHRLSPPPKYQGDELVERVARAIVCASTGTRDPDKLVPAPRGQVGLMPLWQSYEHLARAAIAALKT